MIWLNDFVYFFTFYNDVRVKHIQYKLYFKFWIFFLYCPNNMANSTLGAEHLQGASASSHPQDHGDKQ